MPDLISRQAAIDEANAWLLDCLKVNKQDRSCGLIRRLEDLPTAQPKRGKWIKTARWGRVYYCNQCRNYLDFDGVNAGRGSTNYCPNCGADMRQREE